MVKNKDEEMICISFNKKKINGSIDTLIAWLVRSTSELSSQSDTTILVALDYVVAGALY